MLKQKPFKPRAKRCKFTGCGKLFTAIRNLQPYCGPKCERMASYQRRLEKPSKQVRLHKDKSRSDYIQELQSAFNAFIRERDHDFPCVSCGIDNPPAIDGIQWDAGHYRSVGACPELRFHEDNCHKQCRVCNCELPSGGQPTFSRWKRYELEIEQRIGPERLALLEGPQAPKHYLSDELIALKKHYRARTRELQRAREKQVLIT